MNFSLHLPGVHPTFGEEKNTLYLTVHVIFTLRGLFSKIHNERPNALPLQQQAAMALPLLRQCAADLLCRIWPRAASFRLSVHVCCVCPSGCGMLTCPVLTWNLCKNSMVSFLGHCSLQHLELLIHKSILWWYIWKSHSMLLPPRTAEVSDC